MNIYRRLQTIQEQERAYIEGTIECIDDQWIFFDEINEKAFQLEELDPEIELFKDGNWMKGKIIEKGLLFTHNDFHYLMDGDEIRYQKKLTIAFEELLKELPDHSFLGFTNTLNQLYYSVYDCIYCHNFLSFLHMRDAKAGVNTIIFDNEEMICNVQHHFYRSTNENSDRFEFTLSDGKRVISSSL